MALSVLFEGWLNRIMSLLFGFRVQNAADGLLVIVGTMNAGQNSPAVPLSARQTTTNDAHSAHHLEEATPKRKLKKRRKREKG
eukprot:SAG31_NODE_4900_length_2877_cov_2.136069_6_plen_83_part_00